MSISVILNLIMCTQMFDCFVQLKSLCLPLSFGRLCEMVDHVFPLLVRDEGADFPCSDTYGQCNYWNEQLPGDTHQVKEDPQPLETGWGNPIKSSTEDAAFQLFSASQSVTTPWSAVLRVIVKPATQIKSEDADYIRIKNLFNNCVRNSHRAIPQTMPDKYAA